MNGILFSHEKKEILPFVTTWVDLEGILLSEIREIQIPYDLSYMWNLKNKTNTQKTWLIDTGKRMVVARGGRNG